MCSVHCIVPSAHILLLLHGPEQAWIAQEPTCLLGQCLRLFICPPFVCGCCWLSHVLQVAGHFTTCSITVLEQRDGPQFIFGLDMLKRHLCVLDLAAGEDVWYCTGLLQSPTDWRQLCTWTRLYSHTASGLQGLLLRGSLILCCAVLCCRCAEVWQL